MRFRALELLGKELGMFADRKEKDLPQRINEMSDEELTAPLRRLNAAGIDEGPQLVPPSTGPRSRTGVFTRVDGRLIRKGSRNLD